MRRNSSKDLEIRELPDGARQSDENYELTFEQPAEGSNDWIVNERKIIFCVGSDGISTVEWSRHVSADECTRNREVEWYRVE